MLTMLTKAGKLAWNKELPSFECNLVDKNKHRRLLVRDAKQNYKFEASYILSSIQCNIQI